MHRPANRPMGITVLAPLLALKGVVSPAMAGDLVNVDPASTTPVDEPATVVALVIGLVLLRKAYGLWMLHREAWLLMLLLVALDCAVAAPELLLGARTATAWLSFVVALVTVLYLLQPHVRNSFLAGDNDSIDRPGDR